MIHQVNLHAPPGIDDFRNLSPGNFVSITKHQGNCTTTDIYYQPAFVKTAGKKESFLNKLSGVIERLKGFKPANDSDSLHVALKNIKGAATLGGESVNLLPSMMHKLALQQGDDEHLGHEVSNNGTTFTLINWDTDESRSYKSNLDAPKQTQHSSGEVEIDQDPDRIIGTATLFLNKT